jgi:lysophospholipase L1-like esterase
MTVMMQGGRFKGIWVSVLSVAVLLGLAEIGIRIYQHSRGRTFNDALYGVNYRDYFFLGPSFKPGSGGSWQGIPDLKINRYGFRGEEFKIEKAPDEFRIITFGGSTSHSGNYPAKLEKILATTRSSGKRITVINAAVPAWNSTQNLIQLITRAVYLSPDLILVYEAINDALLEDNKWLVDLPAVDYSRYNGFLENYSLLYVLLRAKFREAIDILQVGVLGGLNAEMARLAVMANQPQIMSQTAIFSNNIQLYSTLGRSWNVNIAYITMPLNNDPSVDLANNRRRAGRFYAANDAFVLLTRKVELYNEIIRKIAHEEGAQLIDVAATEFSKNPENFVDLAHFSELGAQRFAEKVAGQLRDLP